jgi:hypothetical protein
VHLLDLLYLYVYANTKVDSAFAKLIETFSTLLQCPTSTNLIAPEMVWRDLSRVLWTFWTCVCVVRYLRFWVANGSTHDCILFFFHTNSTIPYHGHSVFSYHYDCFIPILQFHTAQ